MTDGATLSEKMDILFEWGKEQGINVTYQAIEHATGETYTNILKIRKGDNQNPGLRTMDAIARYFGVRLDYFQCQTQAECLTYLKGLNEEDVLNKVRMRADSLSPEALVTLNTMVESVLQFLDQMQSTDKD